jgi:hypothetical protein
MRTSLTPMRFVRTFLLVLFPFTATAQDFDLILENARIVDGMGNPWCRQGSST